MVQWVHRLKDYEGDDADQLCCIIDDDISFKTLQGYCYLALHLIELNDCKNAELIEMKNVFTQAFNKFMYYDIRDNESEMEYIERISSIEFPLPVKINRLTTCRRDIYNYKDRLVIIPEDDNSYAKELKTSMERSIPKTNRAKYEIFNGNASEYNCHIEVATSFRVLWDALFYFLNCSSMAQDEYMFYDRIEIENRIAYSVSILNWLFNKLKTVD